MICEESFQPDLLGPWKVLELTAEGTHSEVFHTGLFAAERPVIGAAKPGLGDPLCLQWGGLTQADPCPHPELQAGPVFVPGSQALQLPVGGGVWQGAQDLAGSSPKAGGLLPPPKNVSPNPHHSLTANMTLCSVGRASPLDLGARPLLPGRVSM